MKTFIRRFAAAAMLVAMVAVLASCGSTSTKTEKESETVAETNQAAEAEQEAETEQEAEAEQTAKTYKVGICNYVDDASLNQIVENIESRLAELGKEKNVTFEISYDNCNADSSVLSQIIADFIADGVDVMVGVATPVAMSMQAATKDIPIVFAAVSDPVGVGLVESLEAPGANITGSSDYLDTTAIMNLILAQNPDIETVGLFYDIGQDSSTTPIAAAKEFLDEKGIAYKEYNGTTVEEIKQAVAQMSTDGITACFTPTDNTIMNAELSIYEDLIEMGIQHYAGADSFALNGAFLGYGVDYAELGVQTADMVCGICVDGNDPASTPVLTFDNGTATVNTETCEKLGLNYEDVAKTFEPYCTKVQSIVTAEAFE